MVEPSQSMLLVGAGPERAIVRRAAEALPIAIHEAQDVPVDGPRARLVVLCGIDVVRAFAAVIRGEHADVAIVAALRSGESPASIAASVDDYVDLDGAPSDIAARLAFRLAWAAVPSGSSESPLTEVVRVSDDLIGVTSVDGSANFYISPAYEAITGCPRAEILKEPARFLELVHPDDRQELYEAHLHRERPLEYQYRIVRPDGELRWLRARAFPVIGEQGAVARVVTIARDVTDRKRAEDDADAQRALLEGVTRALTLLLVPSRPSESIEAALAVLGPAAAVDRVYVARHDADPGGSLHVVLVHEWTSEGTRRLLGLEEMSGERSAGVDAQALIEVLERGPSLALVLSELPPSVRARLEGSGLRSTLIVPIFADGRCWGQVGFVDCRTERRWDASARAILETTAAALGAAIVRERIGDALGGQLDRMRSLYESAANPALSARSQLERLLAVGTSLLGVDEAAVIRVRPDDVDSCEVPYAHPPDARLAGRRVPLARDVWVAATAADRAISIHDSRGTAIEGLLEHAGMRAAIGAPLWVRGQPWGGVAFSSPRPRSGPFLETDDDFVRLIARGISHQIERMEAEQERRVLDTSLRETQKLESLGLLAGGIAHDFNNLLMVIVGSAALAAREARHDSGLLRESLAQIDGTARRAADLTRQLLAYAGRGQLRIEPTSLSALVEDISALLAVVLPADAALELHMDPALPSVLGDHAQLQQIVLNLITNAGEALEGRPGQITVRAVPLTLADGPPRARFVAEDAGPGRYVVLEVSDTGAGIAAATIERIFEPFFTTKQAGRGLGLAAVLGVVRAHRGAIDVESRVRSSESDDGSGSGATTFRVYLPAAAAPARPGHGRAAREERRLAARVLVVDDNEAVRTTVQRILVEHGAHVLAARDGLEALEVVRAELASLDAVVLDLTMPRMDGARARQHIAELAPRLPVLLTSGHAEGERVLEALERPHTRFLQKPFGGGELVAALRVLIAAVR